MVNKRVFPVAFLLVLAVFLSGCIAQTGNVINTGETKVVTKVTDGDTVMVEGGSRVRLLGMDTDERGYPCYAEAKKRMEELVLNKEAYLEPEGEDKDQYGRYLRYIFVDGENINLRMVQEGLAIASFYQEDSKYKAEIIAAEKNAMDNGIGCKWSASDEAL